MNNITKVQPLPVSTQDLLALRKLLRERTLNDYVDDIHVALWSNPDYHKSLEAVYDEDAIEGSLALDNGLAASLIREYAREKDIVAVRDKKLATIVKALNVVLRRYGIGRKERAATLGDEIVPNAGNGE